jgi:hypothetical protein
MPSQSSAFPYATDIFSNLTNPNTTPTTSSTSSSNNSSILNDNHSNLSLSSSTRNRSGSMSLPSAVYNTATASSFGYNPYDPSSPIDENASNTIASTLASLGLDDEENHTHFVEDNALHSRPRSYTVTGQLGNSMATSSTSRLAFSPFSPHTRSSVLHRPRAISLGMAESFSPFDMAQANPSSSTEVQVSQQSRLRMQQAQSETLLRSSRSSSNLVDMNVDHVYSLEDDQVTYFFVYVTNSFFFKLTSFIIFIIKEYYGQPDGADSPTSAQAQIPSRALWLGNINPSISVPDLVQLFSTYGEVESARILSDKECAFVNFTTMESAVAAKNDLESRLGSKLGGTPVRVGFGKADVNLAMALTNEAGPNAQGPTRALCKVKHFFFFFFCDWKY